MKDKASNPYRPVTYGCCLTSFSTAISGNLSPILFVTFRTLYGLSYTQLGLLVVINFGTQLLLDLVFSFFSHRFHLIRSTRLTPAVMTAGLLLFAAAPQLFPQRVYLGLCLGTVLFSAGSGLSEVLTSPVIAAVPAPNPERRMSMLHASYAWGVVVIVAVSTVWLHFVGRTRWQLLTVLLSLIPALAFIMLAGARFPDLKTQKDTKNSVNLFKNPFMSACVACIFLGGASECTMSQWVSGYLEIAFGIPKLWGDLLGTCVFGLTLSLGRTFFAKWGKNPFRFLIWGSAGAAVCYATAVLSSNPFLGLAACGLTGFCVSMLWPGTLMISERLIPAGGVTLYAFLAAGGDMGAALVPQAVGIIADAVAAKWPSGASNGLSVDGFAVKCGLAIGILFPVAEHILLVAVRKRAEKNGV